MLPNDSPQGKLLQILAEPGTAQKLLLSDWDSVIRVGRMARLLGTLHALMERAGLLPAVPEPVRRHLENDAILSRHRRQMMEWTMATIAKSLVAYEGPLIWLKGASYVAQGLSIADGRLPADVDLMVPRSGLQVVEGLLNKAGWRTASLSRYDDRYYRQWSHELPPMRRKGHPLEVDVHHTILPMTGRLHPDADALFRASVALPNSRLRVLSPEDQVLHAAAQLFQDSDFNGRLRDLVDIDGLIRTYSRASGFWTKLKEQAALHEIRRPLWYAVRYCSRFLGTPIPENLLHDGELNAPGTTSRLVMDVLVPETLLPPDPDHPISNATHLAQIVMLARSHWLRMPPWLLVYHVWHKAQVAMWPRPVDASG